MWCRRGQTWPTARRAGKEGVEWEAGCLRLSGQQEMALAAMWLLVWPGPALDNTGPEITGFVKCV